MKIVTFSLMAFALVLGTATVQAQTADELISKHIDALGGKEKISQIKSVYMEGSLNLMGNEAPVYTYILNGKGFRNEMEFNGQKIIQAVNTTGGWSVNPMMGSATPEPIPQEQYEMIKDQMVIGGSFLNYLGDGSKAQLLGKEKIDGADAYKIGLVSKDGELTTYFIDPSSFYIKKLIRTVHMAGQEAEVETVFSDYRKTDYGFAIPHKTEITLPQGFTLTTSFKKVEVNKEIDPKIFEMPAK